MKTTATQIDALKTEIRSLQQALQKSQERIKALNIISEVDRSLTLELMLAPLLHKILAGAVQVMNASAGSLLLLDNTSDELVFAVVEGGAGQSLEGKRMSNNTGIAGWVAIHRQPLIVDDVNQDDRYYKSIADSFGLTLTSLICVPMISRQNLIGVLQVIHSTPGCYFGPEEQELLLSFASKAAITIENARLYESLREERDRLVVVEDEVRKRLARDLHDGPTQFVAALVLNLNFIKELLIESPETAVAEVEQNIELADETLKQLRTLLFDLRPVILETQGLIPALEVYTERLRETDHLSLSFKVLRKFKRLSKTAESTIFAVIQEAVNNAKKHAHGADIEIILEADKSQDALTVTVQDKGQGFDLETLKSYDKRGSIGLINMRERTEAIGGDFRIQSEVGVGTTVTLGIPLSKNSLQSNH